MRCRKGQFIQGQYFHIYNHAINDELLFREDEDYIYFLEKFKLKLKKYPTSVFAYCLMPNHFHFLLRQDSNKPIYKIFNDLNNSYVPHYNFKYNRKGRLYRSTLKHINIKKDNYLIYLCQYIHYNPVKAGLVKKISRWKYSNYLEWIGFRNSLLFNNEILTKYYNNSKEYIKQIEEHEKYMKNKDFNNLIFD